MLTLRQAVVEFWRTAEVGEGTAAHSLNILLLTDEKGQRVHLRSEFWLSYMRANY